MTTVETSPAPDAATWRDPKLWAWPLGLIPAAAVPLTWALHTLAAPHVPDAAASALWWFAPVLVFVLIPIADHIIGVDGENPPAEAYERLENTRYYRWCTYLYLPLEFAGLVLACHLWAGGGLAWHEALGVVSAAGIAAGIGINTAHELGHKVTTLEGWLSRIALAPVAYGHFYVEHNRGHHVRVATPEDPASARMGESFYRFWPRTVAGSLRSAIRLERRRLDRRGLPFWSPRNDLLTAWAMTVVLFAVLVAVFGVTVLPYLLAQAVIGFSLLEVVNYLEHYGLLRERRDAGDRYVRCQPRHSWNSDHVVTNVFLYHLQRHSDHHANPVRRYQALRSFEEAPMLPGGYATMIPIALVPPLWYRIMHPRLLEHYGGDLSRANIAPGAEDRLRRRLVPAGR